MRKILLSLFFSLLLLLGGNVCLYADNQKSPLCVSVTMKGALQKVEIGEGDAPLVKEPLSFGSPIELGSIIEVADKGRGKILCNGNTLITLLDQAEVQVAPGELTAKTPYLPWIVKLAKGEIRLDRYSEDAKTPLPFLRIVTPNALIRSRSVSARVAYYERSDITDVAVFDGFVEIKNSRNLKAEAVKIAAGENSRAAAAMSPSRPVKMEKLVMKRFLEKSAFSLEVPPDPMFDRLILPLVKGEQRETDLSDKKDRQKH